MKPLLVVTDASHGIGKAVAAKFAAEGYALLLVARQKRFIGLHPGSSG